MGKLIRTAVQHAELEDRDKKLADVRFLSLCGGRAG